VTDSSDVVIQSIDALRSVLNWRRSLPDDWLNWFNVRQVVLTGIGKSFDVARLGASVWQSVGIHAQAVHATELLHGGFGIISPGASTTLVLLSHSGRTPELLKLKEHIRVLRNYGRIIQTVAITSDHPGNQLSTLVQRHLLYSATFDGSRHGTIPSVSTTAQLAWLNVVACGYADALSPEQLALHHPAGDLARIYERMPSE
jgi:D-arabinose 5-phosphate isomerase GutQ